MNTPAINNAITNVAQALDNIDLGPNKIQMKTGKAKSWLGEYHWVSLAKDPDADDNTDPAIEWCLEHFGKSGARWYPYNGKFFFKDERDMSMFILRWS
jgi:hypothetical protein